MVDLHERPGHGHAHVFEPPPLGARTAPDSDQHLVGGDLHRRAVLGGDRQLAVSEAAGARTEVQLDAVAGQPFGDWIRQGLVEQRQDAVGHLHDGDLGAQLAIGDAQLQPDVAAADDDQLLGHLRQAQRLGGGDDVAAERQERKLDRLGPGGQDDVLGGDHDVAVGGLHRAGLGVREGCPAGDHLDLGLLQQGGDAVVQLLDDAVLPLDRLLQVDGRLGRRDAQRSAARRLGHRLELAGCMDDGLGRNAADVQARPAEAVATVHQHGVEPQLPATDARDIAAGAGADDQDFGLQLLHSRHPISSSTASPGAPAGP